MSANEPTELGKLKQAVTALQQMRAKVEALQRAKFQPIAIVGMACRFPGGANSPQEYWDLLRAGRDTITEVPAGRFGDDGMRKIEEAGVPALKWGGFLDQVDQFDPSFFGIAPREAVAMDPQQRILLEVVFEALESGGFPISRLTGSRTGVFVGVCSHSNDYYMLEKDVASSASTYIGTGNAHNIVAGRLSYVFDWRGPSVAVDTACSSSLTALYLAVQSLRAGDTDLCVAGGVNVLLTPEFTIHAAEMDMFAPDGRCKPFDVRADGFVRSDGCGVVLLKRLADAQANHDRILAVIRAAAANQDGRSNGLTAPNGLSQQAVIRQALEQAKVAPGKIGYIETHGTGTVLGDPIEAESFSAALGNGRDVPCFVGSAKANIGHAEGAAGVAGVIKTVLSLQNEAIPPLCHFHKLSPHISTGQGFVFPTRLQHWPRGKEPRVAGVSSFGWSGTNVHVVLEESPTEPPAAIANRPAGPYMLPMSAHNEETLKALASNYTEFLRKSQAELADICYCAAVKRTHHSYRLVVSGDSAKELGTKLEAFLRGEQPAGVIHGKVNPAAAPAPASSGSSGEPNLSALAARYASGDDVDWSRVYSSGRSVSLPPYPWQRKRYWYQATGGMSQPAASQSTNARPAAPARDWSYELTWEEKPVPLAEGGKPREALEAMAQDYAAAALQALGFPFEVGAVFAEDAIFTKLAIVPKYRRLFGRMVSILAEGKYIARQQDGWVILRGCEPDLAARAKAAAAVYPDHRQEFGLLMRCGEALPQVLRGVAAALDLLFPADSEISAASLYRNSVCLNFYNELAGKLVSRTAAAKLDRPLRILEVGAGTGATTRCILQQLLHEEIEYHVTDISPTLLSETADRLAGNPSLRYAVLDIESDPAMQEFAPHTFDFVICANVLHATRDLRTSLSHVRKLLRDDGLLMLLETTAPRAWVDLTFGLTEGWWRFADNELRSAYPLLTEQRWIDLLRESGFAQCESVGTHYSSGAALEQSIFAATGTAEPLLAGRRQRWVILADTSPLGTRIAAQLASRNHECVIVRAGRGAENGIDPANPDDYARLFAAQGEVDGVVHLWNLDIPANAAFGLETLEIAQMLGVDSLVNLLHALGNRTAKVCIVTRHSQTSGTSGHTVSVGQNAVWGFGRALAIENPDVYGGIIDIDDGDIDLVAAGVVREICDPDGEDQVILRGNRRYAARLVRAAEVASEAVQFRKDASYLITGGLGGLGRKLAIWMAERGAGQLALIGRSGVPERSEWGRLPEQDPARATVAAIRTAESCGAHVRVERVDVGNPEAVSSLLEQIRASGKPLAGVIHCATAIGFLPIARMDAAAMQNMFRAKARGAWILHELTRTLPLDFFILFSSAACQLGAKDLAHYAAANQFLDGLAHYRHSLKLPAVSIDWGEWDETRSLTTEQREFFERSGLVSMDSNVAFPAMFQLVASGVAHRMIAAIDADVLKPAFEFRGRRPFLDYLRAEPAPAQPVQAAAPAITPAPAAVAPPPAPSTQLVLDGVTPEERRELVASRVLKEVAQALGTEDPTNIDPERGLFDMGMDSLMSVQLRKRLEASFGRTLPKMLTFTYPNVAALTRYLLGDGAGDGKQAAAKKAAASAAAGPVGNISGAEARELLLQELDSLPPDLKG